MKILTRYAKKRLKLTKIFLNSFLESNDPEMLHRMRLEIKKIKMLLRLIQYNHNSFRPRSSFIPFRTIFRACEKIREPQVLHALVVKFTGDTELPAPDLSDPIQQFVDEIPGYLRSVRKQEKIILKEIEKIKSETYKRYLRKKNKILKRAIYPVFKVGDLHAIRKLIKEVYYLLCINNKNKTIDPFFKQSDALIGAWHDKTIVIEKIKKSVPPQISLIKKLQEEKRADIAKLKRLTKAFYN